MNNQLSQIDVFAVLLHFYSKIEDSLIHCF